MRKISLVLSLFVLSVNGQTFSIVRDSVAPFAFSPQNIKVQKTAIIINKTNSIVEIDSIFLILLPQPVLPPPFPPLKIQMLHFIASTIDSPWIGGGAYTYFIEGMKSDSLYKTLEYNDSGKDHITIRPKDTMMLSNFYGSAVNGVLIASDTNRFALFIFKSGTTSDTLTLMGKPVYYVSNTVKHYVRIPAKAGLNTHTPSEIYNIRGQRIPLISKKNQLRIIKNGTAIKCGWF